MKRKLTAASIIVAMMRSTNMYILLQLALFLTICKYGYAFTMRHSIPSTRREQFKNSITMAATAPQLNGISYRVSDLERSIAFYTTVFGMKLIENGSKSSAKLTMDSVEEGQSAMTIELLGGFTSGSDLGDVSISSQDSDVKCQRGSVN